MQFGFSKGFAFDDNATVFDGIVDGWIARCFGLFARCEPKIVDHAPKFQRESQEREKLLRCASGTIENGLKK